MKNMIKIIKPIYVLLVGAAICASILYPPWGYSKTRFNHIPGPTETAAGIKEEEKIIVMPWRYLGNRSFLNPPKENDKQIVPPEALAQGFGTMTYVPIVEIFTTGFVIQVIASAAAGFFALRAFKL